MREKKVVYGRAKVKEQGPLHQSLFVVSQRFR